MLKLPHLPLTFLSALVGRSAYALVILPLLFAVHATTGSVAIAGIAVAAYGVTASFLAPFRAQLIDRHGRKPVLLLLAVAFGGSLVALAVGAFATWSGTTMVVLAGLAGAVAPPLGPAMRVAWSELAKEPAVLRKALSFDAVVEELLYLVGPAAAGFALVVTEPGLVLLVPAVLVLLGTALFVSSPVIRHAPRSQNANSAASARCAVRRLTLLGNTHFIGLLLPVVVVVAGLVSGNLTIAIPAASRALRAPPPPGSCSASSPVAVRSAG